MIVLREYSHYSHYFIIETITGYKVAIDQNWCLVYLAALQTLGLFSVILSCQITDAHMLSLLHGRTVTVKSGNVCFVCQ